MTVYKKVLLLIILVFFIYSCKTLIEKVAVKTSDSGNIRVKLTPGKKIRIPIRRHIVFEDASSMKKIKFKREVREFILNLDEDNSTLSKEELSNGINIYSKNNRLIVLNKRAYFGSLKIIAVDDGFELINYIPLETYLMSVLFSEMPLSFHIEALKAQAVVARTYAKLFMKKYSSRRAYDVDDTVRYQVYKGYDAGLAPRYIKKLEEAITATRGQIVVYDNEPILAYFHANSGGKLRSGMDYFGEHSNFSYLVSKDDPYSLNYPGASWHFDMSTDNFINTFDLTTDLTDDFFIYNESGFLKELSADEYIYSVKEIRKSIGYALIKSERFRVTYLPEESQISFDGIGYGHGVGMSQWGAEGMAREGLDYKDIIAFYYPETFVACY